MRRYTKHTFRRFLMPILGLALLASTLAFLLPGNTSLLSVLSFQEERAPQDLFADPRTVDAQWILDKFEFPGAMQTKAVAASADEEAFDRFLHDYFRSRPDVRGLPIGFLSNRSDTIEFYHQGLLVLGKIDPIPFEIPPDWARTDLGPTFQAELHSWRFLTNFLIAYQETGEQEYLDVLESIAGDWIERNPYENPSHPRAWHEGALSKRILVLLNLYNHYKNIEYESSSLSLRTILAMIVQHAEYFALGEHYRSAGNHGIRQDMGLLAAVIALPESKRANAWEQIATDRLRTEQIEKGFSHEGVWRESSPVYHDYVMKLFENIFELVNTNETDVDLSFVHDMAVRSRTYMAHVLTPSGRFPPIGDSAEKPHRISEWSDSPNVQYAASLGVEGESPDVLDGFFPDTGDAIFRDTWGNDPQSVQNALYIHVHAAFHPGFGHRHADDLSFVVHGLGRWWILEAGKFGYPRDKWRDYIASASAHNGYTFNRGALSALDKEHSSKDVAFEDTLVSTDDLAAVRGRTNRFSEADTSVTRTVVFLRNRRTVILLDHLQSPESGDWQQYLQIPPDIAVKKQGGAQVIGHTSSHPDLELEISSELDESGTTEIVIGQEDPVQGWYSPEFEELVPAPTVVFERTGSDLVVATIIRIKDRSSQPVRALSSSINDDVHVITWREGAEQITVTINALPPLKVNFASEPVSD
jgi:hypothetical protein